MWRLLWKRFLQDDNPLGGNPEMDSQNDETKEDDILQRFFPFSNPPQCLHFCEPKRKKWMFFVEENTMKKNPESALLLHLKIFDDPSLPFFENHPYLFFWPSLFLKKHNVYPADKHLRNINTLLRKIFIRFTLGNTLSTDNLCSTCERFMKNKGNDRVLFGHITESVQKRLYLTDFRGRHIKIRNVHAGNFTKISRAWLKRYPLFQQSCLEHSNTKHCKKYFKQMPLSEVENSCTLQNYQIMYEEDTIYHFWYKGEQIGSILAYKKYGSLKDYLLFSNHKH